MSRLWTDDEIELLKWYYTFRMDLDEFCNITGRGKRASVNKAYDLGIGRKNFTDEEKQYVIDNYKSYNLQEIAKHLGRNKTNVCRLAKELGIERTNRKLENPKTYRDDNGNSHEFGWVRKTPKELYNMRSKKWKDWHSKNEHPRGMTGKTHTKENREKISKSSKNAWDNMTPEKLVQRRIKQRKTKIKNGTLAPSNFHTSPYSRTKGGKRKDLNDVYFRSGWEANVARYYNYLGIKWEFEPKRFIFDTIKRGSVSYMPDFYLPDTDQWVEVKGWLDQKSKTKLKRFAKYYPEENKKLIYIGQKEYNVIRKEYKHLIKNWEGK